MVEEEVVAMEWSEVEEEVGKEEVEKMVKKEVVENYEVEKGEVEAGKEGKVEEDVEEFSSEGCNENWKSS